MTRELEERIIELERQMKQIAPIIAALSRNPSAMLAVVQTMETAVVDPNATPGQESR